MIYSCLNWEMFTEEEFVNTVYSVGIDRATIKEGRTACTCVVIKFMKIITVASITINNQPACFFSAAK